jgi:hypothetical protein
MESNSTQKNSKSFVEALASVYLLESNGAVERANKIVFSAISKMLFNLCKGKWIEELPKVIWSPQHNSL